MKTNYHQANQSTSISNSYLNNNFIPRSGQVSEGNNPSQREYAWQVASNLLVSFRYATLGLESVMLLLVKEIFAFTP